MSFSNYNEVYPSIVNNSLKYNGRVNTIALGKDPNARFKMYERLAVKNKATDYREGVCNEFESNDFTRAYFSKENIQIIQNALRAGVYKRSGNKQLVIPLQNIDVLKNIMREMFFEYGQYDPNDITGQIARLNNVVIQLLVPKLYSEAIGYLKYLQDTSSLVVPIDLPQQNDRCFKELKPFPFV